MYTHTHTHTHTHIYIYIYTRSAINKKEILSFATPWIDFEVIMLSDVSQTE